MGTRLLQSYVVSPPPQSHLPCFARYDKSVQQIHGPPQTCAGHSKQYCVCYFCVGKGAGASALGRAWLSWLSAKR
jgi:hypothetical protein